MEKRTGTKMQLGACSECGAGCSKTDMQMVEIKIGNLVFRLCEQCEIKLGQICQAKAS